jgi:hypothetical protein
VNGFYTCPDCGHSVTESYPCLYCQVREPVGDLHTPEARSFPAAPGDTPEAVRLLLASLEGRYADDH